MQQHIMVMHEQEWLFLINMLSMKGKSLDFDYFVIARSYHEYAIHHTHIGSYNKFHV